MCIRDRGGAITGFFWGLRSGSAIEAVKIETGHQYNTLIEMGVSHEVAKDVAIAVGLVNGGLEFVSFGTITAPVKNALMRATMREVSKSLVKPTVVQVLKAAGTDAFKSWVAEVGTELVQELVNVAGEDFANYFEEGEFESKLLTEEGRTEIAQRLRQVFEVVATGMAPLAILGGGVPTYVSGIKNVQKSTRETAFIDSLTNLSTTDKTK